MSTFFRACPNCHKFFYDFHTFKHHKCGDGQEASAGTGEISSDSTDPEEQPRFKQVPPTPGQLRHQEQASKRATRKFYLAFLKEKGIDMSKERSFQKIEEAYKANGGGEPEAEAE